MKSIVMIAIVGCLAWDSYQRFHLNSPGPKFSELSAAVHQSGLTAPTKKESYRCDGRIHCSQMTSCEESHFFLRNCPGVKLDGDHDGVPCERKWCHE